jgi:hypothetical protein
MDMLITAIWIDIIGWGLWFLLTWSLSRKPSDNQLLTWDYQLSTLLLALSSLCSAAATLLERPVLLWGAAVPLVTLGLTILAIRSLRNQARGRPLFASDVEAAEVPAKGKRFRTMTTPPSGGLRPAMATAGSSIYADPLIRDIESRRMPA